MHCIRDFLRATEGGDHDVGLVLIYIAATLTLWSMIVYLRAAWPILLGSPDPGDQDDA